MISLPSCFIKLILFSVVLPVSILAKAQPVLFNVPQAFSAIVTKPSLIELKNSSVRIPAGGHLQGIQLVSDSAIIITASSASFSYYLIANANPNFSGGQISKLQKIEDKPFRHAGGCQVNEGKLVAGIEDNLAKNKSEIMLISFNSSLNEINRQIIARRQGIVKRSTAGATGFTRLLTGQCLFAVGDWNSRNIDFYISRKVSDTLFDSLTTYRVPGNKRWCSYQSINLLIDTAGNIYLVGCALDGLNNRADLFKVELSNNAATLNLISSRNFKCSGGASFRYGSGIGVSKFNSLAIYSCARNAGRRLSVNIFKRP